MRLLRNAISLVAHPALAGDYLRFRISQAQNGGEAVRTFAADNLQIGRLSGFSEFHSCARFINKGERRFLKTFPFPDGAIVDIGGNLGLFSLLMARNFPERIIHAFEPNPTTFEAMRVNFARNGCPQVQGHALAIAAHNGEVSFQADSKDRATNHIVPDCESNTSKAASRIVRVPCVTLDNFASANGIEKIGLLKVDVEGYEDLVFRGAENLLLSGNVKTIYYEVCPKLARRADIDPDAPSRRLLTSGYRLYVLTDEGKLQPADLTHINSVILENWVAIWKGWAQ